METPYDESWDGTSGWRAVTGGDGLSGDDGSGVCDGEYDGAGWSGGCCVVKELLLWWCLSFCMCCVSVCVTKLVVDFVFLTLDCSVPS